MTALQRIMTSDLAKKVSDLVVICNILAFIDYEQ